MVSCLEKCPQFKGVLIEGLHCNTSLKRRVFVHEWSVSRIAECVRHTECVVTVCKCSVPIARIRW